MRCGISDVRFYNRFEIGDVRFEKKEGFLLAKKNKNIEMYKGFLYSFIFSVLVLLVYLCVIIYLYS